MLCGRGEYTAGSESRDETDPEDLSAHSLQTLPADLTTIFLDEASLNGGSCLRTVATPTRPQGIGKMFPVSDSRNSFDASSTNAFEIFYEMKLFLNARRRTLEGAGQSAKAGRSGVISRSDAKSGAARLE